MKHQLLKIAILTLSLTTAVASEAAMVDGIEIGIGGGYNNNLYLKRIIGARVGLLKSWQVHWLAMGGWHVDGYWDLNLARWYTDPDFAGNYRNITIVGLNPIFRFQPDRSYQNGFLPYLEASVGGSFASAKQLSGHKLGSYFAFEDLLGAGFCFGDRQQYDFSLRFLHYSNAGFAPPNAGISVNYLATMAYHFG